MDFRRQRFRILDRPLHSLELNIIENLLNYFKTGLNAGTPKNLAELEKLCKEGCAGFSPERI